MNLSKIKELVTKEADARFGETIERLLLILRNRHTHKCHEKECWCEYCRYIRGEYVDNKLYLHKLKVRLRIYEQTYHLTDYEVNDTLYIQNKIWNQLEKVRALKDHKKDLQTNII
jgi:hypothetical protein